MFFEGQLYMGNNFYEAVISPHCGGINHDIFHEKI